MKLFGVVAAAALAFLPLPLRAAPITEPTVFDFETGSQGWALSGGAVITDHSALGGRYAIFGLDGSRVSRELDLTDVAAISFDRLFTGDDPKLLDRFIALVLKDPVSGRIRSFWFGESVDATSTDPMPNPDTRWVDLTDMSGLTLVTFFWDRKLCNPQNFDPCLRPNFLGYIDNVTIHPVPGPSTLALLGLAIAGLGLRRKTKGYGLADYSTAEGYRPL